MDFDIFCKHMRVPHWNSQDYKKFNPTDYQKRVSDSLLNNRISICAKFRRGGFSTNSVAFALWNLLVKNKSTLFFTFNDRAAVELQRTAKSMISSMCDDWRGFGDTNMYQALGKDIVSRLNIRDHCISTATQKIGFTTPGAMVGWAPDYLIFDEIAFAKDMEKHWKAIWPVVSTGTHTLIVSSIAAKNGWFEKVWLESLQKANSVTPILVNHLECPMYWDTNFVKELQKNLGPKTYMAEVLCDPHVAQGYCQFVEPKEAFADALARKYVDKLDKPLERAFKNTLAKTGLV
jgi:hypothetical protein